jgi:hypothetical protein
MFALLFASLGGSAAAFNAAAFNAAAFNEWMAPRLSLAVVVSPSRYAQRSRSE